MSAKGLEKGGRGFTWSWFLAQKPPCEGIPGKWELLNEISRKAVHRVSSISPQPNVNKP
jgi:hypothetical protein